MYLSHGNDSFYGFLLEIRPNWGVNFLLYLLVMLIIVCEILISHAITTAWIASKKNNTTKFT